MRSHVASAAYFAAHVLRVATSTLPPLLAPCPCRITGFRTYADPQNLEDYMPPNAAYTRRADGTLDPPAFLEDLTVDLEVCCTAPRLDVVAVVAVDAVDKHAAIRSAVDSCCEAGQHPTENWG
jgi:hypothetical protein